MNTGLAIALCGLIAAPTLVLADVGHETGPAIGQAGAAADVDRVIEISLDEMSFDPETITVEQGETIRFILTNTGRAVHEFNIGTDTMWDGHREEMRTMTRMGMITVRSVNHSLMIASGMMHDEPNSVLLEPGQSGEVIWMFSENAEFGFACNIPGHRETGMVGRFEFAPDDNG